MTQHSESVQPHTSFTWPSDDPFTHQRERDAWSQIRRNRATSLGETTIRNSNGNTPDQGSIFKKQVRSHYESPKSDSTTTANTHRPTLMAIATTM
jgi:hypothetical protein